jgi:hypothetical protein
VRSTRSGPLAGGAAGTTRPRPLAASMPVDVETARDGRPLRVGATAVEAVREEWVVEDRWWTSRPLRRRYFELVLADGRNVTLFRDLVDGRWLAQRA